MSLIGTVGPFGLAAILSAILFFGTADGGGHIKSLSWGWCLLLSLVAGASFAVADWPFSIVNAVVHDIVGLITAAFPKLTLAALGVIMIVMALWKKMTLRGVSMMGITYWYVASHAGGGQGVLADRIADIAERIASS
ncbi:hypothetical protein [Streptomyces sp. NRRL B-1347]|uniref:hypothetical protein n=1 Tax=Streptomyces sp. NRRL B-1347 TaxID=1476877 RepID=UPI000AA3CE4E|nr:hypothetical protein [Streptomyces sp. NRRL B-1347]